MQPDPDQDVGMQNECGELAVGGGADRDERTTRAVRGSSADKIRQSHAGALVCAAARKTSAQPQKGDETFCVTNVSLQEFASCGCTFSLLDDCSNHDHGA
jgi:hypothetical protein